MQARNEPARSMAFAVALVATLAAALAFGGALAAPPPPERPRAAPAAVPRPVPAPVAPEPTKAPPAPRWSEEAFRVARLVANEAGLKRRDSARLDGPLIALVETTNARANRLGLVEWIEHAHTQHVRTNRDDANAWVPFLSVSLEAPTRWPEDRIPWATDARGRAAWVARLDEAQATLDGELDLVCPAAPPRTWGGPYVDSCHIIAKLVAGTHRIVAGPRVPPCTVRDADGHVLEVLHEPPGSRVESEACYLRDESGAELRDARNVFLARVRELEGR